MSPNTETGRRLLDPLPWTEVNARDSAEIAGRILGLQKAKEPRKYECLECSSSDALQAYQKGGLKCYSCGKRWSNVDAVVARRRLSPAEACRFLAEAFGIPLPPEGPSNRPRSAPVRPPETKVRLDLDKEEAPAILAARSAVYASTLEILGEGRKGEEALSEAGRRYLDSRGLDPDASGWYGFRSLEGRQDWRRLGAELSRLYAEAELMAAAWWISKDNGPPQYAPPFGGGFPALVIPYWTLGGKLSGLRFRRLDAADKKDRYRDLTGLQPSVPFGTYPALEGEGLKTRPVVHVVEGELNAWTLHLRNELAIGLPGAGRPWLKKWSVWLQRAGLIVLWFDEDDAGRKGYRAAVDALADAHGRTWVRETVRRIRLPAGMDTNALALKGELEAYLDKVRL
jgi:hypothetical protein